MLPLIVGILVAGPASGYLSDRYGARPFATGGMLVAALSFVLLIAAAGELQLLDVRADPAPERRSAWGSSRRRTRPAVMNSLPPSQRGAGAGMLATFNELRRACSRSASSSR